jgi:opacity protein-like surface antigen
MNTMTNTMKINTNLVLILVAIATALAPAAAAADTYVSPFVGVTFGRDAPVTRPTFGGAVTFMGRGIGLEVEVGHTPDFFGDEGPEADITTIGASYVAGGDQRGAGVKPYALVGLALLRTSVGDIQNGTENKVALNLGAGLVGFFNATIGLRGEIRYFRGLQGQSDTPLIPVASNFDFWRAIAAVSFRFQ